MEMYCSTPRRAVVATDDTAAFTLTCSDQSAKKDWAHLMIVLCSLWYVLLLNADETWHTQVWSRWLCILCGTCKRAFPVWPVLLIFLVQELLMRTFRLWELDGSYECSYEPQIWGLMNQIWNRRLKKTLFHSCCFLNINNFKSLRNFLCFYIYFLARIVPQYQLWSVLKSVCLLSNFLFLRRKKRVAFVPLQTACLCFLVSAFTSPATHSLSFKNLYVVSKLSLIKREL